MLVWATCHTGSIREVIFSVDSIEGAAVPPHRAVLTVGNAVDGGHGGDTIRRSVATLRLDRHVVLRHVVVDGSVVVVKVVC